MRAVETTAFVADTGLTTYQLLEFGSDEPFAVFVDTESVEAFEQMCTYADNTGLVVYSARSGSLIHGDEPALDAYNGYDRSAYRPRNTNFEF